MTTSTVKRDETVADFTHAVTEGSDGLTPRQRWQKSTVRLPLFSVTTADPDGGEAEELTYTIPAKPNPGLALEFLRQGRTIGPELAISWLIEEAVGAEGYAALVAELEDYEGDGGALLRGFGEKIQRVVMGGLEGPKA